MAKSNSPKNYGNDSISSLKGADRVRKRPAVIFGSDGLEGCEHAVFEINALQARYSYLLRRVKELDGEAQAQPG